MVAKCIICGQRPRRVESRCKVCSDQIAAEQRRKKPRVPQHYLVYRGNVVGLFPNGNGRLVGELLRVDPRRLSKRNPEVVLRLDGYCKGYTREQVKGFKTCVLKLAHA